MRVQGRRVLPATVPPSAGRSWPRSRGSARFHNLGATHSSTDRRRPEHGHVLVPRRDLHQQVPRPGHGRGGDATSRRATTTSCSKSRRALEQRLSAEVRPADTSRSSTSAAATSSTRASYNPGVLAGLTMPQIAAAMRDPSNPISPGDPGHRQQHHRRALQADRTASPPASARRPASSRRPSTCRHDRREVAAGLGGAGDGRARRRRPRGVGLPHAGALHHHRVAGLLDHRGRSTARRSRPARSR